MADVTLEILYSPEEYNAIVAVRNSNLSVYNSLLSQESSLLLGIDSLSLQNDTLQSSLISLNIEFAKYQNYYTFFDDYPSQVSIFSDLTSSVFDIDLKISNLNVNITSLKESALLSLSDRLKNSDTLKALLFSDSLHSKDMNSYSSFYLSSVDYLKTKYLNSLSSLDNQILILRGDLKSLLNNIYQYSNDFLINSSSEVLVSSSFKNGSIVSVFGQDGAFIICHSFPVLISDSQYSFLYAVVGFSGFGNSLFPSFLVVPESSISDFVDLSFDLKNYIGVENA